MKNMRPYSHFLDQIKRAGLRPTRQRLALAKLLFGGENRHVTAELLHGEAQAEKMRVSLATVYNTLHQFTNAGLLREIVVDAQRSYFDTNTGDHHHFYFEKNGQLMDIPDDTIALASIPDAPEGMAIKSIDIVVRIADL
ncbi:MAG: transcriptional repressor [Rhodospirillales bacterium]|nr:transcriptional repressor [Rhodospirillales bacterium]